MRLALSLAILAVLWSVQLQAQSRIISSLGRIEPEGGVVRLAGPSGIGSVIVELRVEEGDRVEPGQVIAVLDSFAVRKAELAQREVELDGARRQLARERKLGNGMATSASKLETLEMAVKGAEAAKAAAEAALDLALVRSPMAGQVLYVHARPGERVGVDGVVELGNTASMYAVAEVYETDIQHVRAGQAARISSPALAAPVSGTVERVGLKVGRMDVLGMDPVAEADARVVEVDILLQDTEVVRSLTNLQVEVEITP